LPCKMIIILHGSTSQKTILNIILAAVRTWNLKCDMCLIAGLWQRTLLKKLYPALNNGCQL
jgi:hypothetical protein